MYWFIQRRIFLLIVAYSVLTLAKGQLTDVELYDVKGDSLVRMGQVSTDDYLVIVFDKFQCPYVERYQSRLNKLNTTYRSKGVEFVYVNADKSDNLNRTIKEMLLRRISKIILDTKYLLDKDGELLSLLDISKAPEVCVLSRKKGKWEVIYQGGIDDNPLVAQDARNKYLENVLEEVTTDGKTKLITNKSAGCVILKD